MSAAAFTTASRATRWLLVAIAASMASLCFAQNADDGVDLDLSRRAAAAADAASLPAPPQENVDAASLLDDGRSRAADRVPMFGEQLFNAVGSRTYATGFNPDYALAIGDRVALRMWGSFNYEAFQQIDPQGNVFVPNVGPIRLLGVPNRDLNRVVQAAVQRVYRDNVGVYASLEDSKPVRVFVTGFVRSPGQYAGTAGESILGYLTRAGGVDPERGSYIDIRLARGGATRAQFDLYDFLLSGTLEPVQLQDGDTIVVGARLNAVRVSGEVFNAYGFEFRGEHVAASEILKLARAKPGATHASILHKSGLRQTGEYHALDELPQIAVSAGDEIAIVADRSPGTLLVRIDGAVESSRVLTLPYGARLKDAIALIQPTPQAKLPALQLFRTSVARRQKEMLEVSLRALESNALTGRSATREEAALRTQEAALITRFVQRARNVEPQGQVILAEREQAMEMLLEDGDVLKVPERSSIVMVHGEVTQPQAIAYDSRSNVSDYVRLAGGTTQKRSDARILLIRQDGTFEDGWRARPQPGDEIMVLPQVGSRSIEVTRGITQILYQIAIAARVALNL
jgi:protein involved in polysaccharide export with SLBB domain